MSLTEDLPAAQRLALAYAPSRARADTLALLALDARLSAVLRARPEPLAAQLRLAWWRDTLAKPTDQWPGREPVLEALRHWRDPAPLAELASAWEALLVEELTPSAIAEFVGGRAGAFAALARQLGAASPENAEAAARVWALADLAAHLSEGEERSLVVDYGRTLPRPPRLPASLRTLAVLAELGRRSLARGGGALLEGPGSLLAALRLGLTGR